MKIFGIGLGRTGTTSLARALKILGYSCVHYPRDDVAIEAHDAAVDETVACQFRRLDQKYPDSKFIYTTRIISSWVGSYERCFSAISEGTETHPLIASTYEKLYGQTTFDRIIWECGYSRHALDVSHFFIGKNKSRLLTFNIMNGDGWEKLCPFLNKPVPEEDFPWLNRSQSSPS